MEIKESMNRYYDERANEYDEIYIGKGPASINDPNSYEKDVQNVLKIIAGIDNKEIVFDLPCGTAFWMPSYYKNSKSIYFFDQSANMLKKAKERAMQLNCIEKCSFCETDVLNIHNFNVKSNFAIVGFFISHLIESEEELFINWLKCHVNGSIIIIDSTWSDDRLKTRNKSGNQIRKLNDGTEFTIYKKYFDENDIDTFSNKYSLKTELKYFGKTMFVAEMHNL